MAIEKLQSFLTGEISEEAFRNQLNEKELETLETILSISRDFADNSTASLWVIGVGGVARGEKGKDIDLAFYLSTEGQTQKHFFKFIADKLNEKEINFKISFFTDNRYAIYVPENPIFLSGPMIKEEKPLHLMIYTSPPSHEAEAEHRTLGKRRNEPWAVLYSNQRTPDSLKG